jgi:predicted permease
MFKNYLKVAFRNLMKHRGYTIINITGLTLGMLCCLLIMLWVQDELSFDRFHKNSDRLYIVVHKNENGWSSSSPWAMTPVLKNDFPEIEKASRVSTQNLQVKYNEQNFYENVAFVDPDFLEMFTFPLIQGNPASVLNVRQSAVISEKIAKKYFRNENPIGKNFQLNQNTNVTVTGIIKDIPSNSSFSFDILVPIINLGEDRLATWSSEAPAYVMLRKNANVERLRVKMAGTINKYDKRMDNSNITDDIFPNSRLHLYGLNGNGSIFNVFIFSAIAIIVLIVACINFINLVTAKASIRGKEIGMRKVLGADKKHIIWQFWGETLVLSIIAFVIAFVLALIILPYFNILADKNLTINFRSPVLILSSLSIILLTSILACSYPVLLFSSLRPIKVLKESFSSGSKKTNIRWTLVVVQFTVSIILIVMAITMNRQFNYIHNINLGFNREQVIALPLNDDFRKQYETIKNNLLQYPNITHITSSSHSPNNINYSNPVYWEGRSSDQYERMSYDVVDYDYLETFEIKLSEGRNFSKEFSTDQQNYIVNEAAVAFMKMDSPIGKMFSIWQNEGKIIGVVKDFHSVSLHNEIQPVVMTLTPYMPPTQVFIRIKPENIQASLSTIENTWKKFVLNYPFQYEFLDDVFRRQYNDEKKIKTLLQIFSALAIFISCIGLFGLAVFVTQRRNKEIGIRKIAGANILEITGLIFQDFAKWLLLAIAFSIPIAWLIMHKWLENFAYKTELSWWIFALAGLLALGIALLTVSWQSWRAATRNPVEALRYE